MLLQTQSWSYLSSLGVILGLVYVEQAGKAEVCDLHVVWVFHKNVAGGQISVDQPDLLQVTHALHTHTHTQIHHPQIHVSTNIQTDTTSNFKKKDKGTDTVNNIQTLTKYK